MKQFYYTQQDLQFAPFKECKLCPHRSNSLAGVSPMGDILHPFAVKFGNYEFDCITLEGAFEMLRKVSTLEYRYGRMRSNGEYSPREFSEYDKLILSTKYSWHIIDGISYIITDGKFYSIPGLADMIEVAPNLWGREYARIISKG